MCIRDSYCALANGGQRVEPHTVRKIVSSDGRVLYEAPQAEGQAVSAETACMLTDMLRTAASEGSANAPVSYTHLISPRMTGTAYVEKAVPKLGSKRSMALSRPRQPY